MLSYSDNAFLSRLQGRLTALEEGLAELRAEVESYVLALRAVMGQAGVGDVMIEAAPVPDGTAGTGSLSPPKATPDAA